MLHQKSKIVNNGSKNLLCAHGWAGQTQLPYWWRISQSEIRNSVAAESEGGQKFLVDVHSPTPFLFARPSVQFLPREARQSVGVPFKKRFELRSAIATRQDFHHFWVKKFAPPSLKLRRTGRSSRYR